MTRLTRQAKAGGCLSKLAPGSLRAAVDSLSPRTDLNLLDWHVHSNARFIDVRSADFERSARECRIRRRGRTCAGSPLSGGAPQPIGDGIAGKPEIILRGDRS
jgi:hypothetical protein